MKNVLVFSDLHGKLPNIPKRFRNSDTIVIFAGDQCNNYPQNFRPCVKNKDGQVSPCGWHDPWNYRKINREAEARFQSEWIVSDFIPHLLKQGIDLNKVVWLNGNHDFVDASKYFVHSCFDGSKTIVVDGIKIGLLVGCLPIVFEWHQEINESEIDNRIHNIDRDIEILVSHSPCYGIKDGGRGEDHIGSQSLYVSIFGKSVFEKEQPYFNAIKMHLFGHSHNYPNVGIEKHEIEGRKVKFVNAAGSRIELKF